MDIYILHDYLNRFETKVPSLPYRSGFDKEKLIEEFLALGYKPNILGFSNIDFNKNFNNKVVLYTSIEDKGLFYKSYIEDIIWGLSLKGAILIPKIEFLRAHHNKVFMEILRLLYNIDTSFKAQHFGSYNELKNNLGQLSFPVVIKKAHGAGSKGIVKANNEEELLRKAKKIANTKHYLNKLIEFGLQIKRYLETNMVFDAETLYRNKFVVQPLITNLNYDWKILIYRDKYFVLQRLIRKGNDFRASGSGLFRFEHEKDFYIPNGLLNYAKKIYELIDAPNLALDIAFDNKKFYLLEFQAISFGTVTQTKSKSYFKQFGNKWKKVEESIPLERLYAESIDKYIRKHYVR